MESFTITLTGKEPELKSVFFPPIELNGNYVIGLVDFQSYNSIFNVKKPYNKLHYYNIETLTTPKGKDIPIEELNNALNGKLAVKIHENQAHINTKLKLLHHRGLIPKLNKLTKEKITIEEGDDLFYYDTKVVNEVEIPEGSYEVMDIVREIQKHFPDFNLIINSSTMKATLISNSNVWDFTKPGLGTKLLGFYGIAIPGFPFISTRKINVNNINVIRVLCNIANGSFLNGEKSHTIHSFYPQAPPGYKIIEVPKNILYFPVNKQILDTVTITFADQDNRSIDFNGEETTITCHIKKV